MNVFYYVTTFDMNFIGNRMSTEGEQSLKRRYKRFAYTQEQLYKLSHKRCTKWFA